MNLIFIRHGEATDNVKELISDKEIYWSTLTEKGIKTVKESIKSITTNIDKIYVSPFPRTIQTAHYIHQKHPKVEAIIDNRIREIYYGKYSGKKNNKNLDNTRNKQINGDYFIKFGDYGENKHEIELRLCNFLNDIYNDSHTVIIVSHGSIISYMKRILNIKSSHINTGEIETFLNVNFDIVNKHIKHLNTLKNTKE